jgi:ankyrin repeat protein
MDNLATKPSVRAIREALKVIPRKLEETYDLVMQRISDQNEDDANLARRLLSWLTYSVRSLTVVELQHALAIEPGQDHLDSDSLIDEEIMLSVCAGIVTVEDESNLIRFIHYTTQEYLERIRDVRFPTAQLEITEACMEYLQQQGPASEHLRYSEFAKHIRSRPFYEYAAFNWGAHADEDVQRVAETRILEFLKNNQTVAAIPLRIHYLSIGGNLGLARQPSVHAVAYLGLSHILKCQIKAGINSEVCNSLGQTPIHIAVSRNHRECVRILLDDDRAHEKEFHRAWTLIRIAAIQGLPEFARLAIESEADFFSQPDPIAISYRGWTVLHEAVLARHVEIVEILCDSGFEVDSVDLKGNSALHLAATEGYDDILRTLVTKGADINKHNNCGETPLHHAAAKNDMFAWDLESSKLCTQLLLEFGAEVNCMDDEGRTPLYGALMWGEDTAQLILQNGGCLNLTGEAFKFVRNILGSGYSTPLPPTAVFQGNDLSLDQAKEKYSKTAKALREERLERLRHHGDVIDISGFEELLKMDDDDRDCSYSRIGRAMMGLSSYLSKYRSSWSVSPISPPLRSFGSRVCIAGSSET